MIGGELQGLAIRLDRLAVGALRLIGEGQGLVPFRKPGRECDGLAARLQARGEPRLWEAKPHDTLRIGVSQAGIGETEPGIQLQRLLEVFDRGFVLGLAQEVVKVPGPQVFVVSEQASGRTLLDPLLLVGRERGLQGSRDSLGDVALDGEDVLQLPVVGLGPQVFVGRSVHELADDADLVARPPHAPLQDRGHAQLGRDLADRLLRTLVPHYRRSRDDLQVPDLRELGEDVLGNAIGEEGVLRIGLKF